MKLQRKRPLMDQVPHPAMIKVEEHNVTDIDRGIWRYLDTNGDGTGDIDQVAATDVVVTGGTYPVAFYIQPPHGKAYDIYRMIFSMSDTGTIDSGGYGNNGTPLSGGIKIALFNTAADLGRELTAGLDIKQTGHWMRSCYDGAIAGFGLGDEYFTVRWTFAKAGGPIHLKAGESLRMLVYNDLKNQGLNTHLAQVQGVEVGI